MKLVIDTASDAMSVALIDGETIVAEHHEVIGRGHAETVVAVVARLVGDRGGEIAGPLDCILVDIGPGSYTGVRIGVAAARALGLAWGVPVAGVGRLALVAAAAFAADPASMTVVATADAGRGRVYWQAFARERLRPLTDPAAAASAAEVPIPAGAAIAAALPRAADARLLAAGARGAALPLYLGVAT